jgi:ABC-type branched-subunit amino acid transport system ATPase component
MGQYILDLNAQGLTFVIIEHNMDFLMSLCRRVVVLNQGSQIATGTPAEIRANPAVLRAYFGG